VGDVSKETQEYSETHWQDQKHWLRTVHSLPNDDPPVKRYLKLGFGDAHTESNQRLMYTSA
jgi:hypothetical protein